MNLDQALMDAHQCGNLFRIAELYQQAAEEAFARQDIDAGCFYLTHGYIFALESDHPDCASIHRRLLGYGREL